ncbi:hypothetical protein [Piscibacillus salipiscarius]|uniref:Uncharacterized protein n=1 Tax=Piscibacillus salipiscarius TaxID=299480 RepID=A0ABW5Q978_9BACI|nr:hypothetical protein [Piscibacillus salipiscarius]
MNIYQALKKVSWEKQHYFKYKFPDLRYQKDRPLKTEEQFLKYVNRKTIDSFLNWELTEEYKNLVILYLHSQVADDLLETYKAVSDKAKNGDEKSVKLFLQLKKEINTSSKQVAKQFQSPSDDEDDYDLDLS